MTPIEVWNTVVTTTWMWQFELYAVYIRQYADGTWTCETVLQIADLA